MVSDGDVLDVCRRFSALQKNPSLLSGNLSDDILGMRTVFSYDAVMVWAHKVIALINVLKVFGQQPAHFIKVEMVSFIVV